MFRKAIMSRDSPPASRVRAVERHVHARRYAHRRQRPKRRDISCRVVVVTFLRRDDLVERRGEQRLVATALVAAPISQSNDKDDEQYERTDPDGDVSRCEKRSSRLRPRRCRRRYAGRWTVGHRSLVKERLRWLSPLITDHDVARRRVAWTATRQIGQLCRRNRAVEHDALDGADWNQSPFGCESAVSE